MEIFNGLMNIQYEQWSLWADDYYCLHIVGLIKMILVHLLKGSYLKGWTLIKFHKICIHYSVIYTKQLFYTFYTTYSTAVIEKTIEFHFDIRFNKNQIQLQSEWNRTKYHKKQLSISRDVDDITSAFVLNPKFYKEHRNVA